MSSDLLSFEISTRLVDQLTRHEGRRLKVYDDATGKPLSKGMKLKGKLTIGVGRNLTDVGVTLDESRALLTNDIRKIIPLINRRQRLGIIFRTLDSVRQLALTNMAFNLGVHGLTHFERFLFFLERGNYKSASKEMLKSKWAKQVGMAKPSKRRPYGGRAWELAYMIETGLWLSRYQPKTAK